MTECLSLSLAEFPQLRLSDAFHRECVLQRLRHCHLSNGQLSIRKSLHSFTYGCELIHQSLKKSITQRACCQHLEPRFVVLDVLDKCWTASADVLTS